MDKHSRLVRRMDAADQCGDDRRSARDGLGARICLCKTDQDGPAAGVDAEGPWFQGAFDERVVHDADRQQRLAPTHHQASGPDEHRPYVRHLFELVVRCVHEGHTEPIIASSQLRPSRTSQPNNGTMSR